MIFEALTIDNALPGPEEDAINKLKIDNLDEFKQALKTEEIKLKSGTINFLTIATDFSTHVTDYKGEYNPVTDEESAKSFTYDDTTPDRLKTMLNDKEHTYEDLAYFIYKVSELLKVEKTAELEQKKINKATIDQLKNLKTEIEKVEVPKTIEETVKAYIISKSNTEFTLGEIAKDQATENFTRDIMKGGTSIGSLIFNKTGALTTVTISDGTITYDVKLENGMITLTDKANKPAETLTIDESQINEVFEKYGVKKTGIVKAITTLQTNLTTENKTTLPDGKTTVADIITYLKEGKVKEIQLALGMKEDEKTFDKRADGRFGVRTLKNLEAGKVVKTKYVAGTEGVAKGGTKAEETSDKIVTTPNGKIIKIANIAHDIYTLTDIASLPEARGTGVEGNAKVYQIAKKYNGSEKTFRFFGNGRVGVVGTNEIVPRSEFVEKKNNKREWKENVENPIWVKTLDNLPKGFLDTPTWEGDTPKYYTVKVLDGTVSDYTSFVFYNNGRVMKVKNNKKFDMDFSINVLKKFKVAKKIESAPKAKTPSTEETVEKSANSSKEFESDMYDKLTDEIEDISVSEFVNAYKAKYPNIASCFATTSFVTQNEENPYFQRV